MVFLLAALWAAPPSSAAAGQAVAASFSKDIAPLFVKHCYACHHPGRRQGKYDLSTFNAARKQGRGGQSIVPGKPAESTLVRMMRGDEEPAMPEDADRLDAKSVELVAKWVEQGAKFDGTDPDADIRGAVEPPPNGSGTVDPNVPVPVTALAFRPKSEEIAVAGHHEIVFWSLASNKVVRRVKTASERTQAIRFAADGATFHSAGGTPGRMGEVVLRETETGKELRKYGSHSDVVMGLAVSPDGKALATGGADRLVRRYEVVTGKETHKSEIHGDWLLGVAFTPDNNKILTASRDKTAKVFDPATGEQANSFSNHNEAVYAAAPLPGGNVVTVGADRHMRFWAAQGDGNQLRANYIHNGTVFDVVLAPDAKSLFTCGGDKLVKQFKLDGGQIRQFEGLEDWAYCVAVRPDGKQVAGGSWDGAVIVWNIADGKRVAKFPPGK